MHMHGNGEIAQLNETIHHTTRRVYTPALCWPQGQRKLHSGCTYCKRDRLSRPGGAKKKRNQDIIPSQLWSNGGRATETCMVDALCRCVGLEQTSCVSGAHDTPGRR